MGEQLNDLAVNTNYEDMSQHDDSSVITEFGYSVRIVDQNSPLNEKQRKCEYNTALKNYEDIQRQKNAGRDGSADQNDETSPDSDWFFEQKQGISEQRMTLQDASRNEMVVLLDQDFGTLLAKEPQKIWGHNVTHLEDAPGVEMSEPLGNWHNEDILQKKNEDYDEDESVGAILNKNFEATTQKPILENAACSLEPMFWQESQEPQNLDFGQGSSGNGSSTNGRGRDGIKDHKVRESVMTALPKSPKPERRLLRTFFGYTGRVWKVVEKKTPAQRKQRGKEKKPSSGSEDSSPVNLSLPVTIPLDAIDSDVDIPKKN